MKPETKNLIAMLVVVLAIGALAIAGVVVKSLWFTIAAIAVAVIGIVFIKAAQNRERRSLLESYHVIIKSKPIQSGVSGITQEVASPPTADHGQTVVGASHW